MIEEVNAPQTLMEAIRYFSDPDICLDFMASLRWPDGITCLHCATDKPYFLKARRIWRCRNKECRKQFSVKVGTVFEDSPLGLDKWLVAIWMLANAKNGISSHELHRAIGVTQKTAWFMLQRIRVAMQTKTFRKLSGEVEVDETYIGGKARHMHAEKRKGNGRGTAGKTIVMGLLERRGEIRTKVVPNIKRHILQAQIQANVNPGAIIYTDELASYQGLYGQYLHEVINHSECYVNGRIHTNNIENFWSLFKRCVKGTYVSMNPLHLFGYLAEQEFRFNNRQANDYDRFVLAAQGVAGKHLSYAELTGRIATG